MKVLCCLIIYLSLFVSSAFSQTIQSEFLPASSISKIKEGDMIEATIRVWPIENADLAQFKKLEKTVLFNAFYLAQILSLAPSENNADVVELKGLFIVKSAKAQPVTSIKYNNTIIDLSLGSISIVELKDQSKDFYILDQSLNSSKIWMIALGILLVLIIVAIVKRQAIKNFIINLRPDVRKKAKKRYNDLFRTANHREDFELLYQEKGKWLSLLEEIAPAHREFFKTLNQYQFKKDWSNEDYAEVRASFDVIRRSFEK